MYSYNPYGAQLAYDPYARRPRAGEGRGYSPWVDEDEDVRTRRAMEEMYRRGRAPGRGEDAGAHGQMDGRAQAHAARAQAQAQAQAEQQNHLQQQQAQAQAYAQQQQQHYQQQQAQAYGQQQKAQQQAQRQAQAQAQEHAPRPAKSKARGRRASVPAPLPLPKPAPTKRAPSASPPMRARPPQPPAPARTAPTDDELANAADTIARHWRRRQALRQIGALAARFRALRREFVFPRMLDYEHGGEGRVVSVRALPPAQILGDAESDVEEEEEGEQQERERGEGARLAYTPQNAPVHAYAEALLRVLNALDAVESGGDARVRERRRAVVRAVEGEAARLERWWRVVWRLREEGGAGERGVSGAGGRGRRRGRKGRR